MTIYIIYAASNTGSSNYSCEPPLGPISLFSSLKDNNKESVTYLDSTIISQKEIEQLTIKNKPDIIALSCTSFNYLNSIRLAEIGKNYGAKIIIGGIHVTHMRDNILKKMLSKERPFDFIVTDQGEPAFNNLVNSIMQNETQINIPNLCYISINNEIKINKPHIHENNLDPCRYPLDYSKIDFDLYSKNFDRIGILSDVKKIGTIFTQRGCIYSGKQKCLFCSITKSKLKRDESHIKSDIVSLIEKGIDHIRISDADFTTNIHHLETVTKAANEAFAETGKKPTFYCFARADEIDSMRIKLLKQMNVIAVFIGYESGSNEVLRYYNKNITVDQNLYATKLLKKNGIQVVCGGIVLGAGNESSSTLSQTVDFLRKLKGIKNTESLIATPLMPLPGSIAFNQLLAALSKYDHSKYSQLVNEDLLNINELIDLWCYYVSGVPLYKLLETCSMIEEIFNMSINFIDLEYSFKNLPQEIN